MKHVLFLFQWSHRLPQLCSQLNLDCCLHIQHISPISLCCMSLHSNIGVHLRTATPWGPHTSCCSLEVAKPCLSWMDFNLELECLRDTIYSMSSGKTMLSFLYSSLSGHHSVIPGLISPSKTSPPQHSNAWPMFTPLVNPCNTKSDLQVWTLHIQLCIGDINTSNCNT